MAVTDQLSTDSCGETTSPCLTELGPVVNRFAGDDWVFNFLFKNADGTARDMSLYTFSAKLSYGSPYTSSAISGVNGSVDASQAAVGAISVTVADALTSTVPADTDSTLTPTDTTTTRTTRLSLSAVASSVSIVQAVIPIRVVRP